MNANEYSFIFFNNSVFYKSPKTKFELRVVLSGGIKMKRLVAIGQIFSLIFCVY